MFNKKTLLSLVALSSFTLAACDTTDETVEPEADTPAVEEPEQDTTEDTSTDEQKDSSAGDAYTNITTMPEEVYDIFLDKYPNAMVTQLQLDEEMGEFVYQIEGFEGTTEYELKVDPMDGSIINESTDTDDDIDEIEITREQVTKIMDLVDSALSEAGEGAQLEEWTIDEDDDIVQLDIDINTDGLGDQERTYNIETGELIEMDD